jgi:hypothetical protein
MTMISSIRQFIGKPGERSRVAMRNVNIPRKPGWVTVSKWTGLFSRKLVNDPVRNIFEYSELLLQHGRVCWGHSVIANTEMFEPGAEDCPGVFVYSDDPFVDRFPGWLGRPASHLQYYHSDETRAPNPPRCYEHYLAIRDEMNYQENTQLSPVLTENRVVYYVSVLIFREHLPHGYLTGHLVPMLTLNREGYPKMAMILPCQLWPDELRDEWEIDR